MGLLTMARGENKPTSEITSHYQSKCQPFHMHNNTSYLNTNGFSRSLPSSCKERNFNSKRTKNVGSVIFLDIIDYLRYAAALISVIPTALSSKMVLPMLPISKRQQSSSNHRLKGKLESFIRTHRV